MTGLVLKNIKLAEDFVYYKPLAKWQGRHRRGARAQAR